MLLENKENKQKEVGVGPFYNKESETKGIATFAPPPNKNNLLTRLSFIFALFQCDQIWRKSTALAKI